MSNVTAQNVKAVIYTQEDCISTHIGDYLFNLPNMSAAPKAMTVWQGDRPGSVLVFGTDDMDSIEWLLPRCCTLVRQGAAT